MKLRSDSRAMAAFETAIPFMLPTTQASSISNASSPFLRLPQELKDCIYHLMYGDFYIHVGEHGRRTCPHFAICKHGYNCCHFGACGTEHRLPVASLRTCRQMYHEARNVLYSANTFEIFAPNRVSPFLRLFDTVSHHGLAVRNLRLDVSVTRPDDERQWDNSFHNLAEGLKTLRHLWINMGRIYRHGHNEYRFRDSPAFRKRPFLGGLLELNKLPLKTVEFELPLKTAEFVVNARQTWCTRHTWYIVRGGKIYAWGNAQKLAWAQSMKSAILGTDSPSSVLQSVTSQWGTGAS